MAQDPARPSPPNAPPQQPSGTFFLGRYRVVDEIGVGGMASVHLARIDGAGGFQKWIAIKRIHPHLVEDESFIQMFLDEARVAARISHPNVATVFELGKEADSFWIAMEYLHGEPLREIMRRTEELKTTMPPEIACRVIADAAEGLHAAHELLGKNGEKLNLVHRDVTPHNLFVTYEGATKVVDFGIAKFSSRMASTRAGTLKGKLAYMSPEQVAGEQIDRRTDIFALGVVLWELTTGQRLFRMDSDLDTLAKVQECNVPKPTTLVRGYPVELERVLLKALAKNKNERYRTAREFSRALQSMLMKRGLFIASEEVATYIRSIFGDRIEKREAHLRWAAELAQTGESPAAAVPDFEGSIQSYDSDVQRAMNKPAAAPAPTAAAPPRPAVAAAPKFNPSSTLPLAQRSSIPGAPTSSPRPAAGAPAMPPRPMAAATAPPPAAAPPPMADLDSMEDDGPTIMAPTPMEEEDYDDNDKTQVATKPEPAAPSGPTAAMRMTAPIRPAAGAPAPAPPPPMASDDGDPTRAQAVAPMMNAQVAVPPRPLPPRGPDQPQAPPVMVAPMAPPPGYASASPFGPTYNPNTMPPAFPNAPGPTVLVPRRGVPMWAVGLVSGVAALMVLLVVYLLAVPSTPAPRPTAANTNTPVTAGNGPFGAARGAFTAALTPSAAPTPTPTITASAIPTTSAAPTVAATDTAPTATTTTATTATATATATATVTATATATATHTGPTQIPTTEKGFLTLVTLPRCDSWSDNGTTMGSCPIVNKPLPVGTHRITVSTNVPKASKTVSVIIIAGQVSNPPLIMLQ